jgi:hypothetical protein
VANNVFSIADLAATRQNHRVLHDLTHDCVLNKLQCYVPVLFDILLIYFLADICITCSGKNVFSRAYICIYRLETSVVDHNDIFLDTDSVR